MRACRSPSASARPRRWRTLAGDVGRTVARRLGEAVAQHVRRHDTMGLGQRIDVAQPHVAGQCQAVQQEVAAGAPGSPDTIQRVPVPATSIVCIFIGLFLRFNFIRVW